MGSLNAIKGPAHQIKKPGIQKNENEASKAVKDDKFKNACADFEAIFIHHMFQSMKKTLPGESLFGQSSQQDMYESMYYQEIATQLARGKGMGLGEALYRQLNDQQERAAAHQTAGRNSANPIETQNKIP
jgi:flagellar protein FlgJ